MTNENILGGEGSWATLTVGPRIVLQLTILERRHFFIHNMGEQKKKAYTNSRAELSECNRYLYELYLEVLPLLRDKIELKNKILEGINSNDFNKFQEAFDDLSKFLYDKGLTKWDTKGGFDKTRAEEENKHGGI